jgi:hypothetical protein
MVFVLTAVFSGSERKWKRSKHFRQELKISLSILSLLQYVGDMCM